MLHSKSDDDIPAAAAVVVAADPPLANTIEYEAIPKLLFVDMQQEDEEKVAAAITKLADLVNESNANYKVTDQALSLGSIAIILLLMRKWHYNRSIQFHGCGFLGWLSLCDGKVDTRTIHHHPITGSFLIIRSGGIETIMAAMKSFPDDDDIQVYGCKTIGDVFCRTNKTIEETIYEAMARFVHKLNGIELVVQVMKKFQNNAAVQQMTTHVLQQLSRDRDLHNALKKGGAPSAVGEATEKHDGRSLQSAANAFFRNMLGG